jgi:hypothetical protein
MRSELKSGVEASEDMVQQYEKRCGKLFNGLGGRDGGGARRCGLFVGAYR